VTINCRRLLAAVLVCGHLIAPSTTSAQQTAPGEEELWRSFVSRLEAGALVSVRLKDGGASKGTVLAADADTFTFKPQTRIPVPARQIRFSEVASIERQHRSMSPAKKVLLGLGVGAGVYMLVAVLVVASLGYD
jgi:hypothetical protein